ncbi:serine/threonine/dual specificity protein kinase, catalytic domain-containing protein [Artemisia annua]|uniref:Serine/threonine/dual specificity protein kinase, catalytic domain-containing protein n=1 Tax=Artemisia annua TaxID=35608 RepID=A0A2U1NZS3_ARTAN|nr:serine/threonine/dual specificity protein kinase, catalytic domain-containing protein [Artemisia annua]
MDYHHCCSLILGLTSFLLISFSTADDAAIMAKLSTSISPTPSSWDRNNFCAWDGITCDRGSVIRINLSHMSLNGTLPSDLNSLPNLKNLTMQGNSLSGPLPTLSKLASLEHVILDGNNFTSIPSDLFQGLTNLRSFSISDNLQLSPWSLPNNLNDSANLQSFQANQANIYGTIPDIFYSFPKLQNLSLSYNNLTGSLPASFHESRIQNLWLNNQLQGLSGTLDVLSSMTQISQVWLEGNAFTGAIPDLSKCTELFDLHLGDNQLTGLVPDTIVSLPKLVNITLKNNKLQGPLPVFGSGVKVELGASTNSFCLDKPGKCDAQVTALLEVAGALGYPMSMAESWLGDNACDRWEFVVCDLNNSVTRVNFAKQKFSGTISPAFRNLTSLRMLSLNDNNLTGSIPDVLKSLPDLQLLNVSNNNLSGLVPVFPSRVKFSSENNLLLGKPTINENINTTYSSGGLAGLVTGIVISGVIFVIGVIMFVSYKCYRVSPSKLQSEKSVDHSEIPSSKIGNVMISVQVLQQVTDNFSDEKVLGRGGFGVVYEGEFDDGTKIAVKRMKTGMKETKGMNEFEAEIAVLTKVRHRHLVALLGYCANDNERLLVYEYMPQGTLSQHLFKWREQKSLPLSWKQRVSIALDVGRGVEYLHSMAQQSFIHRDLKPANILLDDDMRAKVADFGLVKNAPDGKYSIDTRLAGTFGYLAPEYSATGRVTTKVDVYSFGVVLMQLITGRKALDETMPYESCQLAAWFRRVPVTKENMVKYADKAVNTNDNETLESIFKVAELAKHCTTREPFHRPDMGYIVNVLRPLFEQWKPLRQEQENTYYRRHMSLPQALQAYDDTSSTIDVFKRNSF